MQKMVISTQNILLWTGLSYAWSVDCYFNIKLYYQEVCVMLSGKIILVQAVPSFFVTLTKYP